MQERNGRRNGMANGVLPWIAALAVAWFATGCNSTRIDQHRQSFDEALGRGNLEQAERDVQDLIRLQVDTTQYVMQLDHAKQNARWLDEGRRAIYAREFDQIPATWDKLNGAQASWAAQTDNPATQWGGAYLARLRRDLGEFKRQWDKAKAEYAKSMEDLFERCVAAHEWAAAEKQLEILRSLGAQTGELETQLENAKKAVRLYAAFQKHREAKEFAKAAADLASLDELGENVRNLREELLREHEADLANRIRTAISGERFDQAEELLKEFDGLRLDSRALKAQLKDARVAQHVRLFREALAGLDFDRCEGKIRELEAIGGDTAAIREELRQGRVAQVRGQLEEALAANDFGRCETAIRDLEALGEGTDAEKSRLKDARVAQHVRIFREALSGLDFVRCEGEIRELEALGTDVAPFREELRQSRVAQVRGQLDEALAARDFGRCEAAIHNLEELGEGTETDRERLRQARIADIREGMEADWERDDVTAVSAKRDRLAELGDNVDDITERLVNAFKSDSDRLFNLLQSVVGSDIPEPRKDVAQKAMEQYENQWGPIFLRDPGGNAMVQQARTEYETVWAHVQDFFANCEKIWVLISEGHASEGLSEDGRWQRWIRCLPHDLLDDPGYCAANMNVHLLGYAREVRREAGKASLYRLEGMDGRFIDVATDYPPPQEGDIVYLLATTELKDGHVEVLHEYMARRPARHYGQTEDGVAVPTRYDIEKWMNCEYDFTLENLFRSYVCVKGAKSLPTMTYGDWTSGKRTRVSEVEDYFKQP